MRAFKPYGKMTKGPRTMNGQHTYSGAGNPPNSIYSNPAPSAATLQLDNHLLLHMINHLFTPTRTQANNPPAMPKTPKFYSYYYFGNKTLRIPLSSADGPNPKRYQIFLMYI
jgi:hypothetical protein